MLDPLLLELLRDRALPVSLLLEPLLLRLPLPAPCEAVTAAFTGFEAAVAAGLVGAAFAPGACVLKPAAVAGPVLTRGPGSRAAAAAAAVKPLPSPSRAASFCCGRRAARAAALLAAAAIRGGGRVPVTPLDGGAMVLSAFCGDAAGGGPGPDPDSPVWRAFQRCARSACRAFSSASRCTAAGPGAA